MRVPKIQIPKIPEEEKTPLILQLLGIIEQISVTTLLQAEEILFGQTPWFSKKGKDSRFGYSQRDPCST